MYLRLAQQFWSLDNYKTFRFEGDSCPGVVRIELDGLDGENDEIQLCFRADPSDFRFNTKAIETLQDDFIAALDEGRRVFDLDEYFDRFDEPETNGE